MCATVSHTRPRPRLRTCTRPWRWRCGCWRWRGRGSWGVRGGPQGGPCSVSCDGCICVGGICGGQLFCVAVTVGILPITARNLASICSRVGGCFPAVCADACKRGTCCVRASQTCRLDTNWYYQVPRGWASSLREAQGPLFCAGNIHAGRDRTCRGLQANRRQQMLVT